MTPNAPERPRKWRRRFKVLAVAVLGVVGVLLLVGWGLKIHYGKAGAKELAAVTAKIDATEPDWRLEPLVARYNETAPPPERNSATVVLKVYEQLPPEWRKLDASKVPALPAPNHQPGKKRAAALAALKGPTADARTLARTLKDMPDGRYPYEFQANPFLMRVPSGHNDKLFAVSYLLSHEASFSLLDGDPDAALEAARAGLNAARSGGPMPQLMAQIMAGGCAATARASVEHVLACGEPTKGLAELQAEFVREADEPRIRYALLGARAATHAGFSAFESGAVSIDEYAKLYELSWRDRQLLAQYKGVSHGDHAECVRVLSDYIAATHLPWHEQVPALARVRPPASDFGHPLAPVLSSMYAAGSGYTEGRLFMRADLLATAVGIACERFRQKNARWPTSLDEIPKDILPEVPLDPFDNKPLRLQPNPDGLSVIGGRGTSAKPDRVAFRLWNPDQRNLPPKDAP